LDFNAELAIPAHDVVGLDPAHGGDPPVNAVRAPHQHIELFLRCRETGCLHRTPRTGGGSGQAHDFRANLLLQLCDRGGCVYLCDLDREICIGKIALQSLAHFGLRLLVQSYCYILELHTAALGGGFVYVLLYLAAKLRAVAFIYG